MKGLGGGFRRAPPLGPWGETIIKQFVREAVGQSAEIEAALARLLRTRRPIALLHYSPIAQTVEGEPLESIRFSGSSRLEEPIGRYPVSLVVHGHAHRGQPEGGRHETREPSACTTYRCRCSRACSRTNRRSACEFSRWAARRPRPTRPPGPAAGSSRGRRATNFIQS